MSSTLEHFSHPEHSLVLKECDVIGDDAMCYICNKAVIGSPTFTCSNNGDHIECQSFYLHKSCAELPTRINFFEHNQHPLDLLPSPEWLCCVCFLDVSFAYMCSDDCEFCVCVFCASEQRTLDHPGHEEHTLTLFSRKTLILCDACWDQAEDSSYICTTCDFWIHKKCALAPFTIPAPTCHHHSLNLIYSIPKVHRYFHRFCGVCAQKVERIYWLYYCHKCTYFVHIKCATSSHTASTVNEIEEEGTDNEPNLVEFPLHSEESLFDLIVSQCCRLQAEYQGKDENSISILTATDPHIIEKHWSHQEHPLVQLQFSNSENDECDNDYDRRVLICDGCIQPISVSHPSYYACVQCGFFLHSFCATKLPVKLLAGESPFHPQHSLSLQQQYKFYSFVMCGVCHSITNGFYYYCKTCDIAIDIRCMFLPTKIKHKSHHHSLIQRPSPKYSVCSVSNYIITENSLEYACGTCSNFQIHVLCAFYPSRMKHKFDEHPITLRYPPFFYEGVFYCEICEEQVNNQLWLYHCNESDHSFHFNCLRWFESVKLGGTIELHINDQVHTLGLVLKMRERKSSSHYLYESLNKRERRNISQYYCVNCKKGYDFNYFFECDGCGYLICCDCVTKIKDG